MFEDMDWIHLAQSKVQWQALKKEADSIKCREVLDQLSDY
jgi:hypothetical protein